MKANTKVNLIGSMIYQFSGICKCCHKNVDCSTKCATKIVILFMPIHAMKLLALSEVEQMCLEIHRIQYVAPQAPITSMGYIT